MNKGSVLGSEWVKAIPCEMLFRNYIKFSDTIGFSRKSDETIFGGELRKLIPGLQRDKRSVTWVDESGVILPSLEVLRDAFDGLVGQSIEWQQDEQASDDFSDDVEL